MMDIFPSEHHHDPSASVPSLHHPSYPSSLISGGSSEGNISLYALALVQSFFSSLISLASLEGDRPLYAPILAQDIKNATKLIATDIIIAYGLSQLEIHQFVADDGYRIMGPTGSGKSNVRDISYINFSISPCLKIIDILTNQPGRRSGSRVQSSTTEVRAVRLLNHPVHGDHLVFVDTPGFDDTNKSDLEILQIIGNWLQKL